jgi:hypothetical protein
MSFNPFANAYLQTIYNKINEGNCICVLGPELAVDQASGKKLDLLLAEQLTSSFPQLEVDPLKKNDLAYVSMRVHAASPQILDPLTFRNSVKGFYQHYEQHIPAIYNKLAELPFRLILNTSFDQYMALAKGDSAFFAHYNYQRNRNQLEELKEDQSLIYNLFGSYHDPESLILSKAEQIDYLNNLGRAVSKIPEFIRAQMNENSLYLFLGFNAESWHLPLLFRALNFHKSSAAYYYYEDDISLDLQHLFNDALKFNLKKEKADDFVEQLLSGYKNSGLSMAVRQFNKEEENDRPKANLDTGKATLLIMTANPKNTQRLGVEAEYNNATEAYLKSGNLDAYEIFPILDVNTKTFSRLLDHHKPAILHFSGHGIGNALLFYSDNGMADKVSGQTLGKMLSLYPSINCLVLNACYSEQQAAEISQYIPNIIGTDNAIGDKKAQEFTLFFYQHVFAGATYEEAFDKAVANLGLANLGGGAQFVFYKNTEKIR